MSNSPTSLCRQDLALRAIAVTGGDPTPGRFLDVGTGEGEFLAVLAARGYEGLSIDVSTDALARARGVLQRHNVRGVRVEHADVFSIEGRWPLVLCFEVLEHLDDDLGAMRRLAALTEPGGRAIVTVPARPELWGPGDELTGHVRRYTRDALRSGLESAGFEVDLVWSVGVPVANLSLALRGLLRKGSDAEGPDAQPDREARTQHSALARSVPLAEGLWNVLFNRVTLWPAFVVQRALVASPRGAGLIAVAHRP